MNAETNNGKQPLEMRPLSQKKRCRKCGEEKPLYQFKQDGRSQDGKFHTCSACEAQNKGNEPVSAPSSPTVQIAAPAVMRATEITIVGEPEAPKPDARYARLVKAVEEYDGLVRDTQDLLLAYERELRYAKLELENYELKQRLEALERKAGVGL